ncbi:ABC transporter substrate-binding protein [Microbacterium sp. gxy059]|uniref:ABC transporter substrate-binding protein n=1 Tax=Microbacterium sp. gxy059 TaxID=2957199 RepID=UPI003D9986F0
MTRNRSARPRRRAALVSILASAAILAGCAGGGGGAGAAAGGGELPRVATLTAYPALPSALEEGFFDEAFGTDASGMQVDFVASGTDGAQSVAAGHSDIAIGGFDPAVLVGDTGLRLLALSESSPDTHALLVSPDSDIETLDDLDGKKVGGYLATPPSFLSLLFDREGKSLDDIDYTQVPNDGGLAALTSGALDAWYTFDPFYAQAELQDLATPIVTGEGWYLNTVVIITSEDYLEEHPDEVDAFLRAYIEGTEWVNENPEKAADYLVQETGLTPEAAELTMSRRDYGVRPIDGEYREWMDDLGEVYLEVGSITELPDLDQVIAPEPLAEATADD